MNIAAILSDKTIKSKEKTQTIANHLLGNISLLDDFLEFIAKAKDKEKATCIEALELVTKQNPTFSTETLFLFVIETLKHKAPRVKWESAKVIGNIVHLYAAKANEAVNNLILNAKHDGTVVRWSAAFALSKILMLNTSLNSSLLPQVKQLCKEETNNGVKKHYLAAFKKINTTSM